MPGASEGRGPRMAKWRITHFINYVRAVAGEADPISRSCYSPSASRLCLMNVTSNALHGRYCCSRLEKAKASFNSYR